MKPQALATHLFELDPVGHADHHGEEPCPRCPCRRCPLPHGNRSHQVPDTTDAQAEHLRRIGEDQDR
ncbi:hypothetical protein [Micromonospora sp. HUAS LYJ1]|uniref:hypothetical protein n=1 Tax=Micromonospora sp. HUAS LYJ1 TaxID=3061626 RepID=UPI002673B4A3|nr:hypothetical protein [Micromonospora sp. HUAS LYJ1]WKU07984.1 hypothetical protein Q2K16_13625 [Micromonospora sp. HUAS LYJ1]